MILGYILSIKIIKEFIDSSSLDLNTLTDMGIPTELSLAYKAKNSS